MTPSEYQILKESFERRLLVDPKLSHAHLRAAIAIKWHMNQNTGNAWPGISTIMKLARVSRATAFRAIKYLEEAGHATILRKPRGVNHYFPQAEGLKPESQSYETTLAAASSKESQSYETGGYQSYETQGCHSYETLTSEEPSREPLPYGYHSMIPDTEEIKGREEKEEVCQESKQGEESTSFAQPSCAEGASTGEADNPDDVPPLVCVM